MHNFFAGMMGFFLGLNSMFHGGGMPAHVGQTQANQQATLFGNPAPSGVMRGGFGRNMRLANGERPFFGMVTAVNGSTLTVQMQMMMRPGMPSITAGNPQTITVTLDSNTKYVGGAQSDITTNTKIAGIGKSNSDGSITALQVRINPPFPSGFPRRMMRGDRDAGYGNDR